MGGDLGIKEFDIQLHNFNKSVMVGFLQLAQNVPVQKWASGSKKVSRIIHEPTLAYDFEGSIRRTTGRGSARQHGHRRWILAHLYEHEKRKRILQGTSAAFPFRSRLTSRVRRRPSSPSTLPHRSLATTLHLVCCPSLGRIRQLIFLLQCCRQERQLRRPSSPTCQTLRKSKSHQPVSAVRG